MANTVRYKGLISVLDMDKKEVPLFGNVLVVGLGMIGGSFAKALKERGLATLYGADRRESELVLGVSSGVIDHPAMLSSEFIAKMDVIVLATPVRAMESVLSEIKPYLKPTTLLTDVGSTKGSVVEAAKQVFGDMPANFIPGHPIAGAEKSGVLAANSHLFENHMAIVTPLPVSNPVLVDRLHQLWMAIGADVVSMDVEHHDYVLASSSHLPHLLAYTLVDALANSDRSQDVFKFAAGGFRDFTRIASSDPVMWRDVFLSNKKATLATLDHFTERLAVMREAVEQGDGAGMFGVFTRAKSARDHFLRLLEHRTSGQAKEIKPISLRVSPVSSIKGEISLLGDKFLSHKAITLACLSEGISVLRNVDLSGDVLITLQAFRDMGVVIEQVAANQLRIHGVGLRGLKAPIAPINVHESIMSLHLLLPVLAAQTFSSKVIAEGVLLNRPMGNLFDLVHSMGSRLTPSAADCLPVALEPSALEGKVLVVPYGAELLDTTALLALLFLPEGARLQGGSTLEVNRDVFASFFIRLEGQEGGVALSGLPPKGNDITLPGDGMKAAWWMLLASLSPGSKLTLKNVFCERLSKAYWPLLKSAGANFSVQQGKEGGFEVAELIVSFAQLSPLVLNAEQVYEVRDMLPLLCVAAACSNGVSILEGINLLPYYDEDRVQYLVDALVQVGVGCEYHSGHLKIVGGFPAGGEMDCAGDYHLALAMLAIAVRGSGPTKVDDCQKLLNEFTELQEVAVRVGFHCAVAQ
ncbi:3-phosphoshikimate 1-carboxyvinyltransferase [Marinomonas spartinae]|uniref:prephenate dehydrogenase n=2 Tax=Marinomonas spartinae TaxID=1792290 RepID=A0A1A8THE1_9GAMM|nr:3-phosphoshikimate 1-carboxyvinyltransferase [Marinomonas spartinae]